MSDQDIHPNKFSELRSIYEYYIDPYIALYQLKTEKGEELISIYKKIKAELIDSKKYPPTKIMRDILNIIPYNNRYTKSYLSLAKLLSDDYHIKDVENISIISNFLFYEEYGIKLRKSDKFEKCNLGRFFVIWKNVSCSIISLLDGLLSSEILAVKTILILVTW
ncbi:hypothetical protein TVAG_100080 [Trichomonas vaginalis G3]|uniref:Uncharacterized protein n=1 Tax=Trichomonas vaginalis (strain ATCC PRA-98 / G3) TaxID=412133 RepID=A2EK75_TRIV3|nr:hypothetical protein TVAG_100080 [Trichomonas vaginalis G3]|eukprot:XP_001319191.1 hypothetical protein [Trichomonas vaginalis G3]